MTEKEYKMELKDKFITYRPNLYLPNDITFGVEIEYANVVKDTISYLLNEEQKEGNLIDWENKSEFDIAFYNRYGEEENGEVNSPILNDNINTWKDLAYLLKLLKNKGANVTEKCGSHINIGAHILGDNIIYWRNFLLLWILYYNEICKFSSGEFLKVRKRRKNILDNSSTSLKKGMYFILGNYDKLDSYIDDCCLPLFNKGCDIYIPYPNFLSNKIEEDNRIEFRLPNATLKEEIWQNYINFFAKFILACRKELDIEKTLYKIKNKESSILELADYVFDSDIDKNNFFIQTLKTNKIYKKELLPHIDHVVYK